MAPNRLHIEGGYSAERPTYITLTQKGVGRIPQRRKHKTQAMFRENVNIKVPDRNIRIRHQRLTPYFVFEVSPPCEPHISRHLVFPKKTETFGPLIKPPLEPDMIYRKTSQSPIAFQKLFPLPNGTAFLRKSGDRTNGLSDYAVVSYDQRQVEHGRKPVQCLKQCRPTPQFISQWVPFSIHRNPKANKLPLPRITRHRSTGRTTLMKPVRCEVHAETKATHDTTARRLSHPTPRPPFPGAHGTSPDMHELPPSMENRLAGRQELELPVEELAFPT